MQPSQHDLFRRYRQGEKLAVLTCYDAGFAGILGRAGVDAILVGDSLGMVVQGHSTTLPVTLEQMVYHTTCVARGAPESFIIADMPFGSYQGSKESCLDAACRLLAAGANMVKLEGGQVMAENVAWLTARGIPVCGHLGLLPQSVNLTGYRKQGKEPDGATRILEDAKALGDAGAGMVVLEAIPSELAAKATASVDIPTIGIGAGPHCSGQVLVLYDILGIYGKPPAFARDFLGKSGDIAAAVCNYVREVKEGRFPGEN